VGLLLTSAGAGRGADRGLGCPWAVPAALRLRNPGRGCWWASA